jgi:hypothetical protein
VACSCAILSRVSNVPQSIFNMLVLTEVQIPDTSLNTLGKIAYKVVTCIKNVLDKVKVAGSRPEEVNELF